MYFLRCPKYQQQYAVDDAGAYPVYDDGAGDDEHFGGGAEDHALGLILYRRGDDGVCKARYRYERARTGKARHIIIHAEPRQQCADKMSVTEQAAQALSISMPRERYRFVRA